MIKISNVEVFNFEGAFRGLRNPMDSWEKSDSHFEKEEVVLGEKDLKLAQRMISGGTSESKFMRQILVSMDIEAPLYWWKEADTYKVGTVTNSCSTMHKITSKRMTDMDLYSWDERYSQNPITLPIICKSEVGNEYVDLEINDVFKDLISSLEKIRERYLETKDPRYWRALIQLLPCGWNQKRTITLNYQVLREMYYWRRNHKLSEWREFCNIIETLPYAKELICYNIGENNE